MLILSIDGGGVRGIIPATVVDLICKNIDKNFLIHKVDMFAGTSAGSILSAGYSLLKPSEWVSKTFVDGCCRIFAKKTGGGVFRPKYDLSVAREVLQDAYGYSTFLSARSKCKDLLVVVFDAENGVAEFCSTIGSKKYDKKLIYDAVLSSMAAPTYFGDNKGYVDGGLIANNPAMCALVEASKVSKDIRMISIGTGDVFSGRRHVNNGVVGWGQDITSTIIGSCDNVVDYQVASLLGDNYIRLQCKIENRAAEDMDNISMSNIAMLKDKANKLFEENFDKIKTFLSGNRG